MLDEATIRRYHRVMEGKPEVAKDRLSLKYGDLSFEKTKEGGDDWKTWEYSTRIKDDAFEYNLVMTPTRGPMYVGGEGNVGMHQGEDMYYYSFTRLDTKGTLKIGGEERQVSGTLWYDHQFGAMGQNNKPVGWDWFCVQLEDGTDLNISALRHPENDERFNRLATVQRADGSTVVAHDIVVEPLASWTSADTGITYPSGWLLAIPSLGMSMRVLPDFPEQEMRTFGPMRALWEGACGVTAEAGGKSIKGLGYTELVGYGFPKDLNKK
jgi:predicted secreted hydrolase